jgi:hypothetical protein
LTLQGYDYEVEHRKGEKHLNADALTRPPLVSEKSVDDNMDAGADIVTFGVKSDSVSSMVEENQDQMIFGVLPQLKLRKRIAKEQREDPFFKSLIDYLEDSKLPNDPKEAKVIVSMADSLTIEPDGCLVRLWRPYSSRRSWETIRQLAVPLSMREDLLKNAHDHALGGHFHIHRTLERLRDYYWWPQLYRDVENWIKTCETCQLMRKPRGKKKKIWTPYTSCCQKTISDNRDGHCRSLTHHRAWESFCISVSRLPHEMA